MSDSKKKKPTPLLLMLQQKKLFPWVLLALCNNLAFFNVDKWLLSTFRMTWCSLCIIIFLMTYFITFDFKEGYIFLVVSCIGMALPIFVQT